MYPMWHAQAVQDYVMAITWKVKTPECSRTSCIPLMHNPSESPLFHYGLTHTHMHHFIGHISFKQNKSLEITLSDYVTLTFDPLTCSRFHQGHSHANFRVPTLIERFNLESAYRDTDEADFLTSTADAGGNKWRD